MRNLRAILAVGILLAAACSNREVGTPTSPNGEIPRPSLTAPPYASPYCTYVEESVLRDKIEDLYFKNDWPDPSSALSKFNQVTSALAANNLAGARSATKSLIAFITNKFEHLTPAEQQATLDEYNEVVTDLWCFVGISGKVFDLNPGDPAKTFTIPGVGGVWFPPNAVPIGTMVTLTDISYLPAPLNTVLDQFSSYIDIQLIPAHTFTPPVLPIVVICPVAGTPTSGLLLGHNSPTNGFELLAPVDFSGITELATLCGQSSGQNGAQQGWLAHWVTRATSFLLPRPLQAAMVVGGLGGSPLDFSPFGAASRTLQGTDGLGGSPTEFAPRAQPGPAGAPPVNPDLPDHYLAGAVGTDGNTSDPEWPVVTVKTTGGDGFANPIEGVTVTFTIAATNDYTPDSEAQVCDDQGAVQTSVNVVTDADGVAVLPCLKFGNVAGFANVKATFDGSTVGFVGDELLQINANVGGFSSTSLNWLVKSNAGVPKVLSFVTSPSATAAAGVALAQQPVVQLKDALGNEVYQAGFDVTVSVSSGGGTIGGTATVATDADGVATFSGISVNGQVAGVSQTLSFTGTGITTPLTSPVSITPGPATQLAITQQPSATAAAGVAFITQPKVTLQDQFGNTVSTTGNAVASLASGGEALAGTTTTAAVGGVATFTDLRIDGLVGDRTLSFTLDGITSAASNTIVVGAGTATRLAITQQPSSTASAGIAFGTQPIVTIQDAFNNTVNSGAGVTAEIATGDGTLGGTATIAASGGIATFTNLSIGGTIGGRTLRFTSGALTPATSTTITIGAGAAALIKTYMLPGPTAAQNYTYTTGLTSGANASPAPQVIVTDAYLNPVGSTPLTWSPAVGSNGSVLTLGGAGTTNSSGTAQVSAWAFGDGLSELTAYITALPDGTPAKFSASTPTGVANFSCLVGSSKRDLVPWTLPRPNASVKEVTIWMSVTGQSSFSQAYPATLQVFGTTAALAAGTPVLGTATGGVTLPGNNGNPSAVTFSLASAIPRGSGNLYFKLNITAPATRKFQLWYTSSPANGSDCSRVLMYTAYPTLTPTLKGLRIQLTN